MRVKSHKKNTINVITLGCSKNVYDSEVLMGQLKANQMDVKHETSDDANIVVVNTCGFIDNAKEESVNTILEQIKRKEEGKIDKLFVTGCLSERYKSDLEKEMPNVDEVVIKTKEKDLIIKTPQVSKLKSKGIDMYQIMGNDTEEIIKEESKISEEDVLLVSQQANVSEEVARNALEESDGDLAQAILKLK